MVRCQIFLKISWHGVTSYLATGSRFADSDLTVAEQKAGRDLHDSKNWIKLV